jgi:predicted DNA-binding WGR domain protein
MRSGHTRRPREPGAGGGGLRIIGDWALEAHNTEKNHHRQYQVTVGRDLLDDWTVSVRYGRVGQGGQEKRFASAKPEEVRAVNRARLSRRLSGPEAHRLLLPPIGIQHGAGL